MQQRTRKENWKHAFRLLKTGKQPRRRRDRGLPQSPEKSLKRRKISTKIRLTWRKKCSGWKLSRMCFFPTKTTQSGSLKRSKGMLTSVLKRWKRAENCISSMGSKLKILNLKRLRKALLESKMFKITKFDPRERVTRCSQIWWLPVTTSVLSFWGKSRRSSCLSNVCTSLEIFYTLMISSQKPKSNGMTAWTPSSKSCTWWALSEKSSKKILN